MVEVGRNTSTLENILDEVSRVVVGKNDIKQILLVALVARGHVLIEGLAGTGKTTLARTFAQGIGGEFKRIQFAPDTMPADVTGFYTYTPDGDSRFTPGPIFANIVLTDELNRTTPRTQAAPLEAMQEEQVTIERTTHKLPRPFMVIGSQLAYGAEGTYSPTEVQLDRFMFRASSAYPSRAEEQQIIDRIDYLEAPEIRPVVTLEDILNVQQEVRKVYISDEVRDYIIDLVEHARAHPDVLTGPSPRATISLYKGARVLALLEERDFVIPDDVKTLVIPALEHRTRVKPEAEMEDITPRMIIERALGAVPVPRM